MINDIIYNGKKFDLSLFEIDPEKGLVNLTRIAKAVGKRVDAWRQLTSTIAFLEAFAKANPNTEIMCSVKGGDGQQGTWVHRKIAIKFAQWISPEFEVWCIDALDELFQKGTVSINIPKTRIEALKQLVAAEEENERLQIENGNLKDVLDINQQWVSIIKVAKQNKVHERVFNWRLLKSNSSALGYEIKIALDPLFGQRNLYHINVFKKLYPQYRYDFIDVAEPKIINERLFLPRNNDTI